jgi:hypothetical protein
VDQVGSDRGDLNGQTNMKVNEALAQVDNNSKGEWIYKSFGERPHEPKDVEQFTRKQREARGDKLRKL